MTFALKQLAGAVGLIWFFASAYGLIFFAMKVM